MGYKTFYSEDNTRAKRAVDACRPVLKQRLHLSRLIACGVQGCVYKTTQPGTVLKVTSGAKQAEVDQVMWRKQQGWRSHTALPRIHRVYRLDKCAKRVNAQAAYVTVREDLRDVPATKATRMAVTLLEKLEDALLDAPGTERAARIVLHEFIEQHHTALENLHRSHMAWSIWTHITHLQVWLAKRGYTMSDARLSNLGLRVPSLQQGQKFDVVMRDMGFLTLRGAASDAAARRFKAGRKRATALGWLD